MSLRLTLLAILISASSATAMHSSACQDRSITANNPACCVWYRVAEDLQENLFRKTCEAEAHEALRATFHDAIGFSTTLQSSGSFPGGGADGSLIAFGEKVEFAFPANTGLEDISLELKAFADRHNVSYGDIIQFAGAVGISNCIGAPRLTTFVGRKPAKAPSPPNLVPLPTDSAETIIKRFADAGIPVNNLIWLLASHSIAAQENVDPRLAGAPFDSTPAVFDTQFYLEVLLAGTFNKNNAMTGEVKSPLIGEFRLQSDFALARDAQTCGLWQRPINDQNFINLVFTAAMEQMSLLGQNQTALINCTEAVPIAKPNNKPTTFPAGKTSKDLQLPNCNRTFPLLATNAGPPPVIFPVPPS